MAIPLLAPVIATVAAGFVKTLTTEGIKWLAQRAFFLTLTTLILPVVLYNVFCRIVQEILQYAASAVNAGGVSATVFQVTGLAGWIAATANLPATLTIIMTAVAVRWKLNLIGK